MVTESEGRETPDNRSAQRPVVQSLARIAVAMLVAFVGIYAALALSAYKARADLTVRRHQLERALIDVPNLVRVS